MERITSRQNPVVREFRALVNPSRSDLPSVDGVRILIDGAHLLEEAIGAHVPIDIVAIRDDLANGPVAALARRAEVNGARLVSVTNGVLSAISPVRQPSGVVAIARRQIHTLDDALDRPPQLVLMLSAIQDPGNVGAIVRVADACGATGIIASDGSANPFAWKALRASMGSAFRIPVVVWQSLEHAASLAKERGIRVYGAVPRDGTPLGRCDLARSSAILLGGEGSGLPDHLLALSDAHVTIPMRRMVESLNVATAAALIVYEAQRQRDAALS